MDCEAFKPIRMRWVITNKGDKDSPVIRARLVACEVAHAKNDAFHASTPPLEAKTFLFSLMASQQRDANGNDLELAFY